MKIICTQENLKFGLGTIGRIISSSNSLPILNNILIKTENGLMKISSTNLEIAITTQIRCMVEENGETTVVGKTLLDLVNNMPNQNITLQTNGQNLNINSENYHTQIKTLPTEDFPLIPVLDNGIILTLDSQELKSAIDNVVFAASTNQTQPEISGVLLSTESTTMKIVATDRYRLAEKTLSLKRKPLSDQVAIIPQKTTVEISRIIGNQPGEVDIMLSNNQAGISFKDTQIISRLVDGQYPDYQQIIPAEFSTTTVVKKQPLVSALKAAAVFSQNNNSVRFSFSPKSQKLVLAAESGDLGKSEVELAAVVEGAGGEIIFNHRYVMDCLNGLGSEDVLIKTIDDNSPGLILPEGKNDYLYLVMPIKS
jgi:DNA polymerase-3 subunit beta